MTSSEQVEQVSRNNQKIGTTALLYFCGKALPANARAAILIRLAAAAAGRSIAARCRLQPAAPAAKVHQLSAWWPRQKYSSSIAGGGRLPPPS